MWKKKAKKWLAGLLAGAMVLTSGVVIPQNTKTAAAAEREIIGEFGQKNDDGSYTLTFGTSYYSTSVAAGDFTVTYNFRNESQVALNWQNYVVQVDGLCIRADKYGWDGATAYPSESEIYQGDINWDDFAEVMKDAEVTVTVVRKGSTITISHSASGAGKNITWSASVPNCTTGATNVSLGGEACRISIYSVDIDQDASSVVAEFGEKNDDGSYTLAFGAAYYSTPVEAGDFEVTYNFRNESQVTSNWNNYIVGVDGWCIRADMFSWKDTTQYAAGSEIYQGDINWADFTEAMKDAEVTVTVVRRGSTITISHAVSGAGKNIAWSASIPNCTTEAMDVSLGGEACRVTIYKVNVRRLESKKHSLTIDYVDAEGNELKPSVVKEFSEDEKYSIPSPELKGYMPDKAVVEGTMGTEDVAVTVTYEPVDEHKVTVEYLYEDGSEAAESIEQAVDEGKTYSIDSPSVAGYHADKNTVTGTMGAEDTTVQVTYKKVIATLSTWNADTNAYEGGWWLYKNGYKVYKMGNFDITYTFHTQTNIVGEYASYGVGITTNTSLEQEVDGDWFITSVPGFPIANSQFPGSTVTFESDKDAAYAETLQDAEVTVNVVRSGTTITVTSNVAGANGKTYYTKATATNCPGGEMNIFLTADYSELNIYSASESDVKPLEGNYVVVHYAYEDGSKAADDVRLGWVNKGEAYNVLSPKIEGYTPDQPVVSGTMGTSRVEVTITYKKEGTSDSLGTFGGVDENGNYVQNDWTDYSNCYDDTGVVEGDFTVNFNFHNSSAGTTWAHNYAVILSTATSSTNNNVTTDWYYRADRCSNGITSDGVIFDVAFGTLPVTYATDINWDTFNSIMCNADVSVTVTRTGSTITIANNVTGANGQSFYCNATVENAPTDPMKVLLGGEQCMLTINDVEVNGESKAPEASAEPTTEPSDEPTAVPTTEPTAEPTTAPTTEPTAEPTTAPTTAPTKAPTVSKGDKVTSSGSTYKVTNTKDKTVTYTAPKQNKKTSVTVPDTVKVTSNGKKVTYKVTKIAKNAFKNDSGIKKVVIGENITKIEANAFKGCKNLKTIVIESKKLTSVAANALKGTSKNLVIKVPAKKLKAYTKLFKGKGNSSVSIQKA